MSDAITEFRGRYAFLSNFYGCEVAFEGQVYPSVEHAFQAAKTLVSAKRKAFLNGPPAQAKRRGRQLELRPDWENVKLGIMEELLRTKFQDVALRDRLLATAPRRLVEGNTWGDTFWGVCNGRGHNYLGRLLMELRLKLAQENTPMAKSPLTPCDLCTYQSDGGCERTDGVHSLERRCLQTDFSYWEPADDVTLRPEQLFPLVKACLQDFQACSYWPPECPDEVYECRSECQCLGACEALYAFIKAQLSRRDT